jgi:hypothetical protein
MKYIKSYNSFIFESANSNIVDEILTSLSDDIQYLIGKYEESYRKNFNREPSSYDKELIRLKIIWDMVKSIEIYTLPTDSLVTVSSTISNKGNLEISAQIQRGGEVYNFNTEVIYAGFNGLNNTNCGNNIPTTIFNGVPNAIVSIYSTTTNNIASTT